MCPPSGGNRRVARRADPRELRLAREPVSPAPRGRRAPGSRPIEAGYSGLPSSTFLLCNIFEAGWGGKASPPQTRACSLLRLRIVLRVSQVREAVAERHVVHIDTVAELVVRRLVEVGGQRRPSCESLKLDVHDVIGRPAPVREARVVPAQNSQTIRVL